MGTKTLAVSAIKNGTVIDHITAGQAYRIVKFFNLGSHHKQITLGLNLPSDSMEYKDIIKIEEWELMPDQANQVAILAPRATINIIEDFKVTKKFKVSLPASISSVITCPNPKCISNHETINSFFHVLPSKPLVRLQCKYCRKMYTQNELD